MESTDLEETGGKYKHELTFNLKPHHYKKFLKKQGFELSPKDLENDEADNKVSMKVHPNFHRRFRHALRHKKHLRIMKTDYEKHFMGAGEKGDEKTEIKKTKRHHHKTTTDSLATIHKEVMATKPELTKTPDHLLIPHGQLLRGVPIYNSKGGDIKVPLSTDVYTFATRHRIKKSKTE